MAVQFLKGFDLVNYNNLFQSPNYSMTRVELSEECCLLGKENKSKIRSSKLLNCRRVLKVFYCFVLSHKMLLLGYIMTFDYDEVTCFLWTSLKSILCCSNTEIISQISNSFTSLVQMLIFHYLLEILTFFAAVVSVAFRIKETNSQVNRLASCQDLGYFHGIFTVRTFLVFTSLLLRFYRDIFCS